MVEIERGVPKNVGGGILIFMWDRSTCRISQFQKNCFLAKCWQYPGEFWKGKNVNRIDIVSVGVGVSGPLKWWPDLSNLGVPYWLWVEFDLSEVLNSP